MLDSVQHLFSNMFVASLIATLAWSVGRSGRHSALAHLLWVTMFLKLISPPIAVLEIPVPAEWLPVSQSDFQPVTAVPIQTPLTPSVLLGKTTKLAPAFSEPQNLAAPAVRSWSWSHAVWGIWTIGFLIAMYQGARRFFKLQALIRTEGEPDEASSQFVSQLVDDSNKFRLFRRRSPRVVRIPIRISPMLFGIGSRTVIVCPDVLWHSFTSEERNAFLAHETAHFVRRDHWVRWIEWLVSAAYWWLPVLVFARRQLEMHEEAACDHWAVQQLNTPPRNYAEALLKAVDFMSTQHSSTPRLASSMQATGHLEWRLRLVMKAEHIGTSSRPLSWLAGLVAVSLVVLHPLLAPASYAEAMQPSTEIATLPDVSLAERTAPAAKSKPHTSSLPRPPQGFWNQMPPSQWASFSLSLPSASVIADAEQGIKIQVLGNDDLLFSREQLTTMVDLPASRRIAIGSADGSLRVWDLEAGKPVSLIGRHPDAVVSIDNHETCGLVSADANGLVAKWNLQSGERLASFVSDKSIMAIRINPEGTTVAVLTGSWQHSEIQTLTILDAVSLQPIQQLRLNFPTAIMVPDSSDEWLLVDWAGNVRTFESERLVARIPKVQVSALVFASSRQHKFNQSTQGVSLEDR